MQNLNNLNLFVINPDNENGFVPGAAVAVALRPKFT